MNPIVIMGCDRSGTTMLGSMLAKLEGTVCLPESQFLSENMPEIAEGNVDYSETAARFANHYRFQAWLEAGVSNPEFSPGQSGSYRNLVETCVNAYAESLGRASPSHFVEHSPQNLFYAIEYSRHFPDAKFIQIVRDGRAVAASLMPQDWGPNNIQNAANYWANMVAVGMSLQTMNPGLSMMTVRYEDLVIESEGLLKQIAGFLPKKFRQEEGAAYRPPSYAADTHSLVNQPPEASRIDQWKKHLSAREVEIFESIAGDLLRTLGYTAVHARAKPRSLSRREAIVDMCVDWVLSRRNRGKNRKRHNIE